MFKLYDMNARTLIDKSKNEDDIINTLCECMKEYLNIRYKIIYHDEKNNEDIPYKKINSVSDYYLYVNEYAQRKATERLKQMSCQELKKEMLELSDKPKAKILKRDC